MSSLWTEKYESRYPAFAFRVRDKNLAEIIDRFCINKGFKTKQEFGDYLLELFKKDRVEYNYTLKD